MKIPALIVFPLIAIVAAAATESVKAKSPQIPAAPNNFMEDIEELREQKKEAEALIDKLTSMVDHYANRIEKLSRGEHDWLDDPQMAPQSWQHCSPAVRRSLAQRDVKNGSVWNDLAQCLASRPQEAIFFLHVSKSGGTSMCKWAVMNGCHDAASAEKNCTKIGLKSCNCWSREMGDGPRWFDNFPGTHFEDLWGFDGPPVARHNNTCNQRLEWVRRKRITFFAVEDYVSPEMAWGMQPACSALFTTVMTVRDPVDRLFSHYINIFGAFHRVKERLMEVGGASQDRHGILHMNLTILPELLPQISNNLYVRQLLGKQTYELPFGAINASHLASARRVIGSFDWILPLDSPSLSVVLSQGLGLQNIDTGEHVRHSDTSFFVFQPMSAAERAHLAQVNFFDHALVAEARRLHALDVKSLQQLNHHVSDKGYRFVPRKLSSNCCGFACSRNDQ